MRALLLAVGLGLTSAEAGACDFNASEDMSAAEIQAYARKAVSSSSVIADVVVENVSGPPFSQTITLRTIQTLKGPRLPAYQVKHGTCDIEFDLIGERTRVLLLTAEDGTYRAEGWPNGSMGDDIDSFNREVDKLIGHKRPPGLSSAPGLGSMDKILREYAKDAAGKTPSRRRR